MADGDATAPSTVELDAEGKRLQLRAEKAKYLEAITKSEQAVAATRASSLASVLPAVAGAPKGEVALGDKAGAFGPWRAHSVLDQVADKIAEVVVGLLEGTASPRVLVVDDRSLVPDAWTAHHVRSTLDLFTARLEKLDQAVGDGLRDLRRAIASYEAEDRGRLQTDTPPTVSRRGAPSTPSIPAAPAAATTAAPAGNALEAAVDLLGLLRTDYTISAIPISTAPTELSTLTAGHLARPPSDGATKVVVEVDGFTTVQASPSLESLHNVIQARDTATARMTVLEAGLAPVDAELDSIKTRLASVLETWAKATADKKDDAAIAALRAAADDLVRQQSKRQKVAAPARTLLTHARQVVADVDAAVAGFLKAPTGAEAPMVTAVRRERLDCQVAGKNISHVLYVKVDALAADAVTRRSILGTSGRIRFLSASNASWLLLEPSSGAIVGGGQVERADVTSFGLEKGTTRSATVEPQSSAAEAEDPLEKLESSARWVVVALVVLLTAAWVLSVLMLVVVAQD